MNKRYNEGYFSRIFIKSSFSKIKIIELSVDLIEVVSTCLFTIALYSTTKLPILIGLWVIASSHSRNFKDPDCKINPN